MSPAETIALPQAMNQSDGMSFLNHLPMITCMLIGFTVGTLQWRKARRFDGLKRRLARMVSVLTYLPALTILGVLVYGDFTLGWPGPIIVGSILLSIATWIASLIWAGPAEFEDKQVFIVTVGLVGLMIVSAGGLHLYFITYKKQGKHLKFDPRDQGRNNKLWDFSDQVKDNMFWSLGSGVLQLTGFQVVTMWLMANGYAPTITLASNPVWFVLALILIPIWSAFHFYWVHRLLHVPFLYKRVHSLHHRNVNIGPWSGFSMHPVEHFLYLTTLCIHWIVASHPIHLIFHIVYQGPGAAMTHTGYEDLLIKDKRRLALGTFYHQLHHRYYECNYGNQEMPWDRWFGTFHDGSEEATRTTRDRKKKMHA